MKSKVPKKLLFVCMGNICRSPAAEAVMQTLIQAEGLEERIVCDSAGTTGYHAGEAADGRMIKFSKRRGHHLTSVARQFTSEDFEEFDYILVMDQSNRRSLENLDRAKRYRSKVYMMTDFCRKIKESEVPDPYYGGEQGFERVLDILEDACQGLLEVLKKEI